jgi:hypothetical protein
MAAADRTLYKYKPYENSRVRKCEGEMLNQGATTTANAERRLSDPAKNLSRSHSLYRNSRPTGPKNM